jgi:hypothetical protein
MAATADEMRRLMREHAAIKAQMKFLTNSLIGLSKQSTSLKDLIWRYRHNLRDFKVIVQRHIEIDDRIFEAILDSNSVEQRVKGHQEICQQVDGVILLADDAVKDGLGQGELEQDALDIKEAIPRICQLIETHMSKEDELLKRMQKDL